LFFECYVVANRSQRISWVNVNISQNICNLFFICMLHNRHTKVWFLPCKSMVFGVQKGGFYNAKRGFLQRKKGFFERAYRYIGCVNCSNDLCDRLLCTTLDGVFVCRKGRNK